MALTGLVGAVYMDDAAPLSDNAGLILKWVLNVDVDFVRAFGADGPEIHGIPGQWTVQAEAYWGDERFAALAGELVTVRLFLGAGESRRCLEGPALLIDTGIKATGGQVVQQGIEFKGVGPLRPRSEE